MNFFTIFPVSHSARNSIFEAKLVPLCFVFGQLILHSHVLYQGVSGFLKKGNIVPYKEIVGRSQEPSSSACAVVCPVDVAVADLGEVVVSIEKDKNTTHCV